MIDYRAGVWGFHVVFGLRGSLAPRALVMAIPNAVLTYIIATMLANSNSEFKNETVELNAQLLIGVLTPTMIFILYNRSRTSYSRWWEGGTLLQKTRGEWFNAYSSIMAFTSTKPELQEQVTAYAHLLARLMSLLMCCGLQQVSPNRDRPFEIIDLAGIEPSSMDFLNSAPDKVEIILQWIQRSIVIHMQDGVVPVAPPILSRAFQELSRGIVNLQNARKIADYPYPYPLVQVSMILQLVHWAATPFAASLAMSKVWATIFSFITVFVLWCIHFNALDLEFPFGNRVNDLPMQEFQQDWNNSIRTLVDRRATSPPKFEYVAEFHKELAMAMSDASSLYRPKHVTPRSKARRKVAKIVVAGPGGKDAEALDSVTLGEDSRGFEKPANQPHCIVSRETVKPVCVVAQPPADAPSPGKRDGIGNSTPAPGNDAANPAAAASKLSPRSRNQPSSSLVGSSSTVQTTLPVVGTIEPLMLDQTMNRPPSNNAASPVTGGQSGLMLI